MRKSIQERFAEKVRQTNTCWYWLGAPTAKGYGTIGYQGKTWYAHRLSYLLNKGEIPEGLQIDHICHTRICVRPEHLRVVTNKQNLENLGGLKSNNTSGFRGVTWDKHANAWRAVVRQHGKTIYAGLHKTAEQAGVAAQAKRNEIFTHHTN